MILALLANVLLAGPTRQEPLDARFRNIHVLTIHDQIDDGLFRSIERRVTAARAGGADLLVFELDTPGGALQAAFDIADFIFDKTELPTVAYVKEKAYSAGALIALACRELVLREGTEIGDCAPIIPTTEGPLEVGEKVQSPLRAKFRKFAERNGYPVRLSEAMVTRGPEIRRVRLRDGTERFVDEEELKRWSATERDRIVSDDLVLARNQLLTMHAREALDRGFARALVPDEGALWRLYLAAGGRITRQETSWSEELVRSLQNWSFILLVAGLLCLYLEFKTPGFGLFGVVGIAALGLFFFSGYLTGLAEHWEILLFVVGLALLAVEIFLIPGFGVAGVAGLLLVLLSLYFASVPRDFSIPDEGIAWQTDWFERVLWRFVGVLAAVAGLGYVAAKVLPRAPVLGRMFLPAPFPETAGGAPAPGVVAGARGTALTPLRPAGIAVFGADRVDVLSEGDFVERGATVLVLRREGNRILVQREA